MLEIYPTKETNNYTCITEIYDTAAFNGSVWKLDLCQKKRCPPPPNCSNKCEKSVCRFSIGQEKKAEAQDVILGKGCLYYQTIIPEVSVTFRMN